MTTPCEQGGADSTCPDSPFFDFGIRLGLVFIVETASLSALAVIGLLGYIGYSFSKIKTNSARRWTTVTHVHWYFLSMLVSELIQAIGGIINVRWIADARVTEGDTCTTQGVLKQCGDVGVAFASLAIAIHTFCTLVFRWRPKQSSIIPFVVLGVIWVWLILLVSLSLGTHRNKDYYGNTQYWCWITSYYPVQRIVLEYMWLWITSFINFILYIPMALAIIYDSTVVVHAWRIRFVRNIKQQKYDRKGERALAIKMLVYPAAYTVTVLPIAITRWMGFTGTQIPWAGTVFSDVLFASSGLLNVILFTATRPNLLPRRNMSMMMQPHTPPSIMPSHSRSISEDDERADSADVLDIRTPVLPANTLNDSPWKLHPLKRTDGTSPDASEGFPFITDRHSTDLKDASSDVI